MDIKLKENDSDLNFLSKESLSKGKQTALLISLIVSLQKLEQSPLLMFDEVGHNLDLNSMSVFVELLREMAKHSQVLVTSFSPKILDLANLEILEIEMDSESKIREIDRVRAETIIRSGEQARA